MTDTLTTPEKALREYTADEYLRFTLKSTQLIHHIADHLDQLHDQLKAIYIHSKELCAHPCDHVERESTTRCKNYLSQLKRTSNQLRGFTDQAHKLFTHAPQVATMEDISDIRYALDSAATIFSNTLKESRLANVDLLVNGDIVNDKEAIQLRLLPIFHDTRHINETLNAYRKSAAQRIAQATRGTLPEGLGMVSTTSKADGPQSAKVSEGLKSTFANKFSEGHFHLPKVETKRREPTLGENGKALTGSSHYRHIKNTEATRLLAQSTELEKTRNGEGNAYTRRENEKRTAKPEPETQL